MKKWHKLSLVTVLASTVITVFASGVLAQIRRFDPSSGDSVNVQEQQGGTSTLPTVRQPESPRLNNVPAPTAQQRGVITPPRPPAGEPQTVEELVAKEMRPYPLGAAMVFVDYKNRTDGGVMKTLMDLQNFAKDGLLLDYYTQEGAPDLKTITSKGFQEQVAKLMQSVPQYTKTSVKGAAARSDMPAFTYDYGDALALRYGVTEYPSIVYQPTPDAEAKVFTLSGGIGNFKRAVEDYRRQTKR